MILYGAWFFHWGFAYSDPDLWAWLFTSGRVISHFDSCVPCTMSTLLIFISSFTTFHSQRIVRSGVKYCHPQYPSSLSIRNNPRRSDLLSHETLWSAWAHRSPSIAGRRKRTSDSAFSRPTNIHHDEDGARYHD